jgi:hypothetical protein
LTNSPRRLVANTIIPGRKMSARGFVLMLLFIGVIFP